MSEGGEGKGGVGRRGRGSFFVYRFCPAYEWGMDRKFNVAAPFRSNHLTSSRSNELTRPSYETNFAFFVKL